MPRNKEFDYDQKLEVARNLFWKKGYHATSLNDLVNTLALSKSSIYDSFGNKHTLFLKCLANYIQLKAKEYRSAAAKGKSPLKSIIYVIEDILHCVLTDNVTCLAINSTFELGRTDETVHQILEKQAKDNIILLEELIIRAQQDGEIKLEKDAHLMATYIVAQFAAIWNTQLLFKDAQLTRRITSMLIAYISQ